jgi:hypothetical protein
MEELKRMQKKHEEKSSPYTETTKMSSEGE